tara:strand:- start:11288 stop:12925 length:1638 start_codon:yes stop_codon:yes gene_type:complete
MYFSFASMNSIMFYIKKLLWSTLVVILIASCSGVKKYNEQITALHSVESMRADIDQLYAQLQKNHPKLYQYTPKEVLDFKFDSLKSTIRTPITSRELYKKLAPVVANVRQGHISMGSANKHYTKRERKALKQQKFEFYDLDFEFVDHKLWVKKSLGKDSLIAGSEVIKIADEPAEDLVKLYKSRFSSDGFNKTLYDRYVGKVFPALYYKDKGFVDSLTVTFKLKDSVFNKTFRRVQKDKKQDAKSNDSVPSVKKPKPSKEENRIQRHIAKNEKRYNRIHGFISREKNYTRNFNFLEADSSVAYMKIRAFGNGNYRKFYKECFAKLDSAKTKNLIIDLRDNGGGRVSEIDYLYSFLANKDYQLVKESQVNSRLPYFNYLMSKSQPNLLKVASGILSPFIMIHDLLKTKKHDGNIYYKLRFSKEKQPKTALHYNGNLYVIINGNSFSASSLLATHLKATKRAIFVGEETGGAYNGCVAGIYKIYELPTSKLNIRMGLMQMETPYKQNPDGYGVKPDIKITPTSDDLTSKTDPELEWILATIKNNKNP